MTSLIYRGFTIRVTDNSRHANQCASSMRAAFAEFAADQRREREYAQQARDFNA